MKLAMDWRAGVLSLLLVCGAASAAAPAPVSSTVQRPGHAAIASANFLATNAGLEVLRKGGNAFDAAVAVAATLSVVEPQSSGIGGGFMAVLHRASDRHDTFIDAREVAPAAVEAGDYLNADGTPNRDTSLRGPLSAGIPGAPAGLALISVPTASCRWRQRWHRPFALRVTGLCRTRVCTQPSWSRPTNCCAGRRQQPNICRMERPRRKARCGATRSRRARWSCLARMVPMVSIVAKWRRSWLLPCAQPVATGRLADLARYRRRSARRSSSTTAVIAS